jgi:hypothetical protein
MQSKQLSKDILTIIWRLLHREKIKRLNKEYNKDFATFYGKKSHCFDICSFTNYLVHTVDANYRKYKGNNCAM